MTYAITQTCIRCQRCLSACPTGAIFTDGSAFWIDTDRCNQCAGTYGVSQCWAVCPTNTGCVPLGMSVLKHTLTSCSEASMDYWEAWFARYTRLVGHLQSLKQPQYWQQWFDRYGAALQRLEAQGSENIPLTS